MTSSLHPLQFLNTCVELGRLKAGHSIAEVATPVPSKAGKISRDLLVTDVFQFAIRMIVTHRWLILGLASSVKPVPSHKGCCSVRGFPAFTNKTLTEMIVYCIWRPPHPHGHSPSHLLNEGNCPH